MEQFGVFQSGYLEKGQLLKKYNLRDYYLFFFIIIIIRFLFIILVKIKIGEIISFRAAGTQVGSISTNGSSLPSDRNFKIDITDLTLGLDFVNTLKPSQYNLKLEEDTDPLLFGLIAQDVEESLTAAGVTKNSTVLGMK